MPLRGLQPHLAVEITRPFRGSGYRIGGRLVLTAAHLFPDASHTGCALRLDGGGGTVQARLVWKAPDADVALLELPDEVAPSEPVILGRLPEPQTTPARPPFVMYGWPKWARTTRRTGPEAGGRQVDGDVYLGDTSPEGFLVLEAGRDPGAALVRPDSSDWEGMSGAAVLCDGLVVAVQRQHQNPRRPQSLEAERLARVYDLQDWRRLLAEHGIDPEPRDVAVSATLLDACRGQVDFVLQELEQQQKYLPELYVNRAIEHDLDGFLDAPVGADGRNCYLIVVPAGSGKTNLLCDLARRRAGVQPVVLLLGGTAFIERNGLLGVIRSRLQAWERGVEFRSDEDVLHALSQWAEDNGRNAIIMLDAINESEQPTRMRTAVEDLLGLGYRKPIKFVVTCRDYYWGLFKAPFWERKVVNGVPNGMDASDGRGGAGLEQFESDEQMEAIDRYLRYYRIAGRPVGRAAEQCRHPLLLRFFCEAYEGQDIGDIEDIRLKELFDRYWEHKLVSIADRMVRQGLARRTEDLVEEVGEYLLNLADYMLEHNVRAVSLAEMAEATKRKEDPGDTQSFYLRVRDEFMLLGEQEAGRGSRRTYRVAFVYEEFMEWVMAKALIRSWDDRDLTDDEVLEVASFLRHRYSSFVQILGVMVYLALMLKEERGLALWSLLLDGGSDWRRVVLEAIRKLPAEQLDSDVFQPLIDLMDSGDEEAVIDALDTLKVSRIGSAAPGGLIEVLSKLLSRPIPIARRVALAAGNLPAHRAVPLLLDAARDRRVDVRRNAIASLARFDHAQAAELLLDALRDKDRDIRARAANSLALRGRNEIGPLVSALEDPDPRFRSEVVGLMARTMEPWATEPLVRCLSDSSVIVRRKAVQALGRLRNPEVVHALLPLVSDEDRVIRQSAIAALGNIGDKSTPVIQALVPLLHDGDDAVQRSAIVALSKVGNRSTTELLMPLLDKRVQLPTVIAALGRIGDGSIVERLWDFLDDEDEAVRSKTAEALRRLQASRSVSKLIEGLRSRRGAIRRMAQDGLVEVGRPAVGHLIAELARGNAIARLAVIETLARIGDRRTRRVFESAAADRNARVREASINALKSLAGG